MKTPILVLLFILLTSVVSGQEGNSPVAEIYSEAGIELSQDELAHVESLVDGISWLLTAIERADQLTLEAIAYGDASCMRDTSVQRWESLQELLDDYMGYIGLDDSFYGQFDANSPVTALTQEDIVDAFSVGELIVIGDRGSVGQLTLETEVALLVDMVTNNLAAEQSSKIWFTGSVRSEYQTRIWRLCSLAVPNTGFVFGESHMSQNSIGLGFTFALRGNIGSDGEYDQFLGRVDMTAFSYYPTDIDGEWNPPTLANLAEHEVIYPDDFQDLSTICQVYGDAGFAIFDLTGWLSTVLYNNGTTGIWNPINPVFAAVYVGEPVDNVGCNFTAAQE